MDRYSRNHDKVGTVEFYAVATIRVPLDDPEAYGNMGLQGYDEDFLSETFVAEDPAYRWLEQIVKGPQSDNVSSVSIRKAEFTEDIYEFEGETIHDAEDKIVARRYGQPTDDDTIEWEDWENES